MKIVVGYILTFTYQLVIFLFKQYFPKILLSSWNNIIHHLFGVVR